MNKNVIAVDIGGTNLRFGIVKKTGQIIHKIVRPTEANAGRDAVIRNVINGIDEILAISKTKKSSIVGISLATPGFIDINKGIIAFSPNLPGWRNVNLGEIINDSLGISVTIENDANAAAFGERWLGAGRNCSSLLCITMGTGIGGGIILDNKIWHGDKGMAGEIGHITVNPDGPLCNCGNYGCLEAYSSGTGIINRMINAIKKGKKTALLSMIKNGINEITPEKVFLAAKKGDPLSLELVEDAGKYLGIAISDFANLLNIKTIILYGGLVSSFNLFAKKTKQEIIERTIPSFSKDVKVLKAGLKDDAGLIGAAGIFFQKKGEVRF